MNLRCFYCQTPFTLGRAEILAALQQMDAENMNHYDAHCPRCRRANSVSRQRLEMAMPNWREVASEQASMPPAATETEIVPAPVTDIQPVEPMPLAPAPKAHHTRKRAGSAKKAAPKATAKATSSTKGKKPAVATKKPAASSKSTKKTTAKSKKK